jgi:hypothetical protein
MVNFTPSLAKSSTGEFRLTADASSKCNLYFVPSAPPDVAGQLLDYLSDLPAFEASPSNDKTTFPSRVEPYAD